MLLLLTEKLSGSFVIQDIILNLRRINRYIVIQLKHGGVLMMSQKVSKFAGLTMLEVFDVGIKIDVAY